MMGIYKRFIVLFSLKMFIKKFFNKYSQKFRGL